MSERGGESGVAVASGQDLGPWPDSGAKIRECVSILGGPAAGQKDARAINLVGQFGENGMQAIRRGEAKIRRRQCSLVENIQFIAGPFHQDPSGLGSAAFHPEDSLTRFHNSLYLAAFA